MHCNINIIKTMSSYLTFYLVPKKTKTKYGYDEEKGNTEEVVEISKGEPLALMSYCRSSEVYQAYNDTLSPAYCGMEEKYTELTHEMAKEVVSEFKKNIETTEERLEINYKMLKEGGYSSELWEEIQSFEKYLREQKETLSELEYLASSVYEWTNYSDFEKVLINVD